MRYCGSIRLVSLFEIRLSGSRFPPCVWLMAFTRKPRRRVFPWIASLSLFISIVIQSAHVGLTPRYADGQEEVRSTGYPPLAIQGNAPARYDHVHVRVMRHCRAPGVQHGGYADPCAQVFWTGRDLDHRLGRCLEQDIVDDSLVLIRDVRDRARQRVDDVEVWRREQLGFPLFQPLPRP